MPQDLQAFETVVIFYYHFQILAIFAGETPATNTSGKENFLQLIVVCNVLKLFMLLPSAAYFYVNSSYRMILCPIV